MIVRCQLCGQNVPEGVEHNCSLLTPANESERKARILLWRRGYMRDYMRRRREHERRATEGARHDQG